MIPSLRKQFNAGFTSEKYQAFLRRIEDACGTHVSFRLAETPCFFPKALLDRIAENGEELIRQLVESPEYRARSDASIPPEFRVANEPTHPLFVQVDFGLVRDAGGELQPKLVELQAFPSLYAYQVTLAQSYIDVYGLDSLSAAGSGLPALGSPRLNFFLSGLDKESYRELLRRAIVGSHDPENVILMEIHPQEQDVYKRQVCGLGNRRDPCRPSYGYRPTVPGIFAWPLDAQLVFDSIHLPERVNACLLYTSRCV